MADRLEELQADIACRLRVVCSDWPPELFDAVVANLADITIRYEGSPPGRYDRRATERMLEEMRESALRRLRERDPES